VTRWTAGFLIAIAGYAACLITFVVATRLTTAANAIFLQYSGVVWVLLFSPVILK
jgi:DME family drug/metabolite transporter